MGFLQSETTKQCNIFKHVDAFTVLHIIVYSAFKIKICCLLFAKERFALYTQQNLADELQANVASAGNNTLSCYTVNNRKLSFKKTIIKTFEAITIHFSEDYSNVKTMTICTIYLLEIRTL